jgi:hypothetical protein
MARTSPAAQGALFAELLGHWDLAAPMSWRTTTGARWPCARTCGTARATARCPGRRGGAGALAVAVLPAGRRARVGVRAALAALHEALVRAHISARPPASRHRTRTCSPRPGWACRAGGLLPPDRPGRPALATDEIEPLYPAAGLPVLVVWGRGHPSVGAPGACRGLLRAAAPPTRTRSPPPPDAPGASPAPGRAGCDSTPCAGHPPGELLPRGPRPAGEGPHLHRDDLARDASGVEARPTCSAGTRPAPGAGCPRWPTAAHRSSCRRARRRSGLCPRPAAERVDLGEAVPAISMWNASQSMSNAHSEIAPQLLLPLLASSCP